VSSHAKSPEAAKALLAYLSSADAATAYRACAMTPGK
jgi:ABC-type Fe3+ transport system substrate-binding protein